MEILSLLPWVICRLGMPPDKRKVAAYKTREEAERILRFLQQHEGYQFVLIHEVYEERGQGA